MNKLQIKSIADSISGENEVSQNVLDWLLANLSKPELKFFKAYLSKTVKNSTLKVYHAGALSDGIKARLQSMLSSNKKLNKIFAGKTVDFIRDDAALGGGIRLESGDYVLDYSISAIVLKVINSLKESL